jgi:hypothetical protein
LLAEWPFRGLWLLIPDTCGLLRGLIDRD